VRYPVRHQQDMTAVNGVSLSIGTGETVGLVGESGSGKSTIGRAILGLTPVSAGTVTFDGADVTHWTSKQRRPLSSELQVVFQDPYSSLNPARTVGQTLAEGLRYQRDTVTSAQVGEKVRTTLQQVGLPADAATRFPGHFSGGQRQRIAIARALMGSPRLVICDEPVSALDLSVQAQVLNLLKELQSRLGLSYLFISHDLAVVRYMAQRIVVLYRGMIMEEGDAEEVYRRPAHPYTRTLLESAPIPDPRLQRERAAGRAEAPKAVPPGATVGCPFTSRCPYAIDVCTSVRPALERTPGGVDVACHRWREIGPFDPLSPHQPPAAAVGLSVAAVGASSATTGPSRPSTDRRTSVVPSSSEKGIDNDTTA
jgi:peptide/nickel transport system ATP-binding protein